MSCRYWGSGYSRGWYLLSSACLSTVSRGLPMLGNREGANQNTGRIPMILSYEEQWEHTGFHIIQSVNISNTYGLYGHWYIIVPDDISYSTPHTCCSRIVIFCYVLVGSICTCPDGYSTYGTSLAMMTTSNGNIFHVTGLLCGEFTSHQWIPRIKASDAELWCFLWSEPK